MRIYGVDFTCAPRRAKPITVASGFLENDSLVIGEIEKHESFGSFEAFLMRPGPWIGGFDFPFSLPRELVRDLGWPAEWTRLVAHCCSFNRVEFRSALDAYRATRPLGSKYAHRATDLPAGSSSPMKLVNPPVALMFHEGARRLLAAGLTLPGLLQGEDPRVALEAYPGLLVRRQLGIRVQVDERALVDEGSGDLLDAVICAVQAAWAARRPRYGLPEDVPSGEGWILSAGTSS